MKTMTRSEAIKAMVNGKKIKRKNGGYYFLWNFAINTNFLY